MSHDEIMRRVVASVGLSWDAIVEPTATLADLDADSMSRFVQTIKDKGRLAIPAQATDQEVMRKLELIKNEKPTRAALLLFGANPESFFPSAFLKLGRYGSITNNEYRAITHVSKSTATRELNELKEKEILISQGTTGRGFSYYLKGSKGS